MAKNKFDFEATTEGVSEYIKDLFENVPDEVKADLAINMVFEVANQSAYNAVEAVGILELAKTTYIKTYEKITREEIQKLSN